MGVGQVHVRWGKLPRRVVAPFIDPADMSSGFNPEHSFRAKKSKLVDAAVSKMRTMDAQMMNAALAAPGSALAFMINCHMAQRILASKPAAKVGVLSLALNLAAIAGAATHTLVLEFDKDTGALVLSPALKEKLRIEGIAEVQAATMGNKPFNLTLAASNLSRDLWTSAATYLSREGCSAFARRRTLGAFAMPKGQAVPTGTTDKFVSRCATILGLTLNSESERAVYYTASKCFDRTSIIYDQITVAMKQALIEKGQLCEWAKISLQCRAMDSAGHSTPLVAIALGPLTGQHYRGSHKAHLERDSWSELRNLLWR